MLLKVQSVYDYPINFEEVPYESAGDLRAISTRQTDGTQKILWTTPISSFSVSLTRGDTSAYSAAHSVVSSYTGAGLPGVYNVVQVGEQLSVVPAQVRSAGGVMRVVAPIMSLPVEFPLATRGVVETLQLVTQAISSRSGAKVILLNTPFSLTDTVTLSSTGEAARDVLHTWGKFSACLFPLISFQCLYEATNKTYYLNLTTVFLPTAGFTDTRLLQDRAR